MCAQIVELSKAASARGAKASGPSLQISAEPLAARFQFWRGASGERYLHTVYGLIDCPELPIVNYILVNRAPSGERTALRVGRTSHDAETLNLAEVRHRGAQLGANEVHVHFLAETDAERQLIDFDLHARLFAGNCDGRDQAHSRPA